MAVNIKAMSAPELLSLRGEIDVRLHELARDLEKQLNDIRGASSSPRVRRSPMTRRKAEPKYRNPSNTKETWAGRGMKPRWLTTALKSGKKLESFEIRK